MIPRRVGGILTIVTCGCLFVGFVGLVSTDALGATHPGPLGNPRADLLAPIFPASTSPHKARAWLGYALALRVEKLAKLDVRINSSTTLTPTHATALASFLATETNGIEALEVRVSEENDLTALQADAASMVLDYHVYALVTPEVNDVISADTDLAAGTKLANEEPGLAFAIAMGRQLSQNARKEAQLLDTLTTDLSSLRGDVSGLADELVPLVPFVPGDLPDALQVLASAHRSLVAANNVFADARRCLGSIVDLFAKHQGP